MNTNWVPSHVQVTVHQARGLLLKNKNGGSGELYTCVQAEKEKFSTGCVARQTEPEWDHTADIPLMSFDTTLHFTVRQKGRIGDDFIGYITIPLGGFNISSKKSVTHWYKLGSKPGKQNAKLRGDLLLTVKFVSKWMSADETKVSANGDATRPHGMLKRSKSDLKMKSQDSDRLLEKQTSKEKLGIFRRSFKKRPKSPAVEECADDFTAFNLSSHSPITPTDARKRSQTIDVRMRHTSSGSGTKNQSDSDNSDGSGFQRVSAQDLFAEAAALEKDEAELPNGVTDGDSLTGNETAVSPATKRYNFRRKKRPWSMHTVPLSTPTPTKAENPLFGEIIPEGDNTNGSNSKPGLPEHFESSNESPAPITYRARSNSRTSPRIRSQERSYSVSDSQQSVRSESNSESCSESTTPVCSPKMSSSRKAQGKNSHVRSATVDPSQRTKSSHSESSTMPDRPESELTDVSSSADSNGRVHISDKKTSPISSSRQPRPRLLNFGSGVADARPSTAPANCRDSRHSSGRPALPAPSRVSPRPPSVKTSPVPLDGPLTEEEERTDDVNDQRGLLEGRSTPDRGNGHSAGSGKGKDRNKTLPAVQAAAGRKQASDHGRRAEERTPPSSVSPKKEASRKTRPNGGIGTQHSSAVRAPASPKERPKQTRKPPERSSSATSKPTGGDPKQKLVARNKSDTDHHRETTSNPSMGSPRTSDDLTTDSNSATLPRKSKMRHTVVYKEKSPLTKKTQQPVSLLPPSIAELRSQTLPTRKKVARQLSNASFFNPKSEGRVSPDKTSRLDKTPENIRTVDRRVLNFPMGPSPTSTPIPEVLAEESPPEEEPLEETDSPAVGVGQELVSDTTSAPQQTNESRAETTAVSTATAADVATTAVSSTENQTSPLTAATPSASSGASSGGSRKTPISSSLNWKRVHERRPMAGGLKRALSVYQENRKETARVRKSLEETRRISDFGVHCSGGGNVSADIERQFLLSPEPANERLSSSLCNSPELRRKKNTESSTRSSWSHPFSLLRWRSSAPSSTTRPRSTGDFETPKSPDMGLPQNQNQSASVPATPHSLSQELHPSDTSSPLPNQQIASAPGSSDNKWQRTHSRSLSSQSALKVSPVLATSPIANRSDTDTSELPPSPRISITSINGDIMMPLHHRPQSRAKGLKNGSVGSLGVLTPTDSESIKTLTESEANLQQSTGVDVLHTMLNGGGNSRQTCSSVESEGLGSLTSEELSLEDLVHQDWGQWSKEELVKELIHSKQRLKGMEDELLSVKRYLDNLLLRIMETNPSILSATV